MWIIIVVIVIGLIVWYFQGFNQSRQAASSESFSKQYAYVSRNMGSPQPCLTTVTISGNQVIISSNLFNVWYELQHKKVLSNSIIRYSCLETLTNSHIIIERDDSKQSIVAHRYGQYDTPFLVCYN